MDKIELIRQEIDRLYGEYKDKFKQHGDQYHLGLIDGLDMAERVLDTLSEEPDKDLEEAADNFAHCYDQGTCDGIAQDCFIAGAKWQAEQDDRDVVFWKGMQHAIAGMKKDAVDGIYTKSIDGKNVFVESGALKIDPASVKVGDSVKLIIIKDDGKSD